MFPNRSMQLFLYGYNVVLFSYDVDSMQHLFGVLEEFAIVVDLQ